MTNRLHLDFKLVTTDQRRDFLTQYLQQEQFKQRPPTEEELETMGNYLLWGKDPVTGLNAKQAGIVDLETKHGTWDKGNTDSLEELMEQPTFTEASLFAIGAAPTKTRREVFSRKEALAKCPDYLRETFVDLFRRIDKLDLQINYYDLAHGKRKNPPRDTLLAQFTPEQPQAAQDEIAHWNQYYYLKMRHLLVELRREQYTLKDAYSSLHAGGNEINPDEFIPEDERVDFGVEVPVFPMGLINNSDAACLVFDEWTKLTPFHKNEQQLEQISRYYWEKKEEERRVRERENGHNARCQYIDFRELEHVYQLLMYFFELQEEGKEEMLGNCLPDLMRTLQFYIDRADLTDLHKEILDMKLRKVANVDIASQINSKWKKTYTPNYISTIFRQRIIPKINEAAAYHEKLLSNIYFEEEFKTCSGCGQILLRDADNFTRKSRSSDGFTARCKRCEKKARNQKGE